MAIAQKTSHPFGRPSPPFTSRDALVGLLRISGAKAREVMSPGIGYRKQRCDGTPALALADGTACDQSGIPVNVLRSGGATYQLPGQLGIGSTGGGSSASAAIPSAAARVPTLFLGAKESTAGVLGFYASADRGESWTGRPSVAGTGGGVRALLVVRENPTAIYAAAGAAGIYKSTDNGATWVQRSTGLGTSVMTSLCQFPGDPSIVIAGAQDSAAFVGDGGVFVSRDGGLSWTKKVSGMTTVDVRSLAASWDGILFAGCAWGGLNMPLYWSRDRGETWSTAGYDPLIDEAPAIPALVVDPQTDRYPATRLWLGVDGSVSANGYGPWTSPNAGVGFAMEPPGGVAPQNLYSFGAIALGAVAGHVGGLSDTIYIGTDGGPGGGKATFSRSTDGGRTWADLYAWTTGALVVQALLVDPQYPGTIYAAMNNTPGLARSDNYGVTWAPTNVGLSVITGAMNCYCIAAAN